MQTAAKRKTIILAMLALASIVCAPAFASSHTFEFSKTRAELKTDSGPNRVEQPTLTSITASSYYDAFREVASESPVAPKGAKTWTKASSEYISDTRKAFEKSGGARQKFWENEYATNKGAYSPQNQALIKKGKAAFGTDGKPMVLHHRTPIEYGGTNDFSNLQPMRYTDHSLKPNFGPLHTPPFPE